MVSCLTDISKQLLLLFGMTEEVEVMKKKRIYIVSRHCWSLKSILLFTELLLLFEGPCTSPSLSHLQLVFYTHLLLTLKSFPLHPKGKWFWKEIASRITVLFSFFSVFLSQLTPERIHALQNITFCGQGFGDSKCDQNFKHQALI